MTYFDFLLRFLIPPLAILLTWIWLDRRQHPPVWPALLATALIALVYTTPWDNYLVANGVWSYSIELVSGLTFGWVPVEEYLFFVLQPLLVGAWLITLTRILPEKDEPYSSPLLRVTAVGVVTLVWLVGVALLVSDWSPGRYLSLELVWGLPPLVLQLAFGADILWQSRLRLGLAIVPATLYLSAVDAIAIASGTWTIQPASSLGILIAGILPIEEFTFFLLTNTLIVFTVGLVRSPRAMDRLWKILDRLRRNTRPMGAKENRQPG